jgi:hypothetical protein
MAPKMYVQPYPVVGLHLGADRVGLTIGGILMKFRMLAALAMLAAVPASAQRAIKIDFELIPGYVGFIRDFYNGNGGPNYGVTFTDAIANLSNDDLGPYYDGAPSPITVMLAYDPTAIMNVVAGFSGQMTFYYSNLPATQQVVRIYSGLNGTGTLLASIDLPGNASDGCNTVLYCRFDFAVMRFDGVARSVNFGGNPQQTLFDDISITVLPEPASLSLLAAGLIGVLMQRRRRVV